jgi:GMP synthase (glutamine-hydrolysing)
LGAQLIGEALGAKTERSPEKEVGVSPIQLTPEAQSNFLLYGQINHFVFSILDKLSLSSVR